MLWLDHEDVRIRGNLVSRFGCDVDEGIVVRVQDECGDSDAVDDAGCCRAEVVVVGSGKSGVEGCDLIIKLPQGRETFSLGGIEHPWKQDGLLSKAARQRFQEASLVEPIYGR